MLLNLWANMGIVKIFRGDSNNLVLDIKNGDNLNYSDYSLEQGDVIYFGLMEVHQKFEDAILKKVYTLQDVNEDGDIIIDINPLDTEYLLPGKYYYSIKMKKNKTSKDDDYDVYTLVKETEFWILN